MAGAAFGMHVRFNAQEGQGDALEALLLEAAAGTSGVEACLLYVVSRSPAEPDVVFVTEAWTDRGSHDASLQDPATLRLISRALPLLVGPPEPTDLRVVGGKGV